jgi:hypothetical protein
MTTQSTPNRRSWLPVIAIAALFLFTANMTALAQQTEQRNSLPELNRWNVQFNTGTFMGVTGSGLTPYTGSLASRSRYYNPTFGLELEYMVSLNIGIKATYLFSTIENKSGAAPFKNDFRMYDLGINIYLFKLFDVTFISERINPYITLRSGYTWSNLSNLRDRRDIERRNGHYGLGAGSRFRINDRMDATATYYHTFYNPGVHVDGQSRSGAYETQRLAGFKVGISVKLGSSDRQSARWFRRPRQTSQNLIFI